MQVFKIDKDGFYIEPVILQNDAVLTKDLIEIEPPPGAHKAKFDGVKWIETMTQTQIEAELNATTPKTEIEILKDELAATKEESAQMNLAIIDLWEILG